MFCVFFHFIFTVVQNTQYYNILLLLYPECNMVNLLYIPLPNRADMAQAEVYRTPNNTDVSKL